MTALDKALHILRYPNVGEKLPTITREQRVHLKALARLVDLQLDRMAEVLEPAGIELGDVIHCLGEIGRDLNNIITNKVALETDDERAHRRIDGHMYPEEYEAADPASVACERYRANYR